MQDASFETRLERIVQAFREDRELAFTVDLMLVDGTLKPLLTSHSADDDAAASGRSGPKKITVGKHVKTIRDLKESLLKVILITLSKELARGGGLVGGEPQLGDDNAQLCEDDFKKFKVNVAGVCARERIMREILKKLTGRRLI